MSWFSRFFGSSKQEQKPVVEGATLVENDVMDGGWHSIGSTCCIQIAYVQEQQKLYIRFRQGTIYPYEGFTAEEVRRLINDTSPGKWFNRFIRPTKSKVSHAKKKH